MHDMLQRAALAAFNALAITVATAQVPAAVPRPDPADAKAAVPPTVYASPFGGYRLLGDASVNPWKDTNDTVGKIGGWKAYAKEGRPSAQSATPAEPGHAGHKTK